MFHLNGNECLALHKIRQRELEAAAEHYRLVSVLRRQNGISPLRQRIGTWLIGLGQKVAQQPTQETRLAFSSNQ